MSTNFPFHEHEKNLERLLRAKPLIHKQETSFFFTIPMLIIVEIEEKNKIQKIFRARIRNIFLICVVLIKTVNKN